VADGAVVVDGGPVPHASWVEGYAWSVAFCATCGGHAGWLFTPVRPPPPAGGAPRPPLPSLAPVGVRGVATAAGEGGGDGGDALFALRRAALADPDGEVGSEDDDD
jgi:hypothetical protein